MAVTFNGPDLRIILPSGAMQSIDVETELYSAWKVWAKTDDNIKFPPAFDTIGGDAISASEEVAPFFFLRNDYGWRIRGPEEDATITIIGNLFGRDGALPMLVPTLGDYTQQVTFLVSSRALVAGSADPSAVAAAVHAAAMEGALTNRDYQRLMFAMLAGLVSGAGTGTEHFRDLANLKDRVVVSVDSQGNRSEIVLDPS